jgi:glycosyltransferase involved in cell wall biosynthesis
VRIAVFDYLITPTNPIGGCHLRMLRHLCQEHEFVVFAVDFENPCPERIKWVRSPVVRRPLVGLFVTFHLMAPLVYAWYRLRNPGFDLVQKVESNLLFGEITYTQFCHRVYLRKYWKAAGAKGLRGVLRWLDHALHAMAEPFVFKRVKRIVVPSRGLARELVAQYPYVRDKVLIISNPVDVHGLVRPADFDRAALRSRFGFQAEDTVLNFIALGHFERKGLPILLEAMKQVGRADLKLLVVGGDSDLVDIYRCRVQKMGLEKQVAFAGMQRDVAPYLWASDAFAFPSFYETFSLVTFQAAAAGLPLIVPPLHGVEELVEHERNGYVIEPEVASVRRAIERFLQLSAAERAALGERAQQSAQTFDVSVFADRWRACYADPPKLRGAGRRTCDSYSYA